MPADGLRPEHPACVGGEEQLERHLLRAGVVAGMVGRVDVDFSMGRVRPREDFFRPAGDRGDTIKHAHDRRALCAAIAGCRPRVAADHTRAPRRECLDDRHDHLRIEWRQHLRLEFDHHRLHAPFDEILRQFEADEAGPDHDHPLCGRVHPSLDAVNIVEVAEREHVRQIDARNRRPQRSSTRGEDQRIVGFVIHAARVGLLHAHLLGLPVDRLHARPRADIESKPLPQQLRLGNEEFVTRGDLAADVVGQTAIGERHVRPAFEHHDLRILGEPPRPRRRRCPARHATDDDQFHRMPPCIEKGTQLFFRNGKELRPSLGRPTINIRP
jgi:hypothetical protein